MPDPRQDHPLRRLETRAVMANGKVLTGWYSYPQGAPRSTRQQLEQGLERAYGRANFSIVETLMPA